MMDGAAVHAAIASVAQRENQIATSAVPDHLGALNDLAMNLEKAGHQAEVRVSAGLFTRRGFHA